MAPLVSACSISMPMSSMLPDKDDITGSISVVPFGAMLDEEDRRREKAALSTALDPQGEGATVHWENPKTGRKGSITPVGHAYPEDAKICRAFLGDYHEGTDQRNIQGTACTVTAGEWIVKDSKPFKKA